MERIYYVLAALFTFTICSYSQEYREDIAGLTDQVDSIYFKIEEYEKLGIKSTGSQGFEDATLWLIDEYEVLGYEVKVDTFFHGNDRSYNIIVEQPGSIPDAWVILGAHYDSHPSGPGANDNGSGVVATLEIAKLIKNVDVKYGLRIINFGAEEDGLFGSKHYVANTLDSSEDIKLMFNLDQLGGTYGIDNSRITCERDIGGGSNANDLFSSLYTDTLVKMIDLYTDLDPVIDFAFASDYLSFEQEGYIITGLYQESSYPYYHTERDIVLNMDTDATTQVIKGALAATIHFCGFNEIVSVDKPRIQPVAIYPNPASDKVFIRNLDFHEKITIYNHLGQKVPRVQTDPHYTLYVSHLPQGTYTISISSDENQVIRYAKLIIAR